MLKKKKKKKKEQGSNIKNSGEAYEHQLVHWSVHLNSKTEEDSPTRLFYLLTLT